MINKLKHKIGFWCLKDLPKAEVKINKMYYYPKDAPVLWIANNNPFVSISVTDVGILKEKTTAHD